MLGIVTGGWDGGEERVEHRTQVGAGQLGLQRGRAAPGVGVDDGEVDLVVGGVEVHEQLVDLVDHFADAGVGPVDLVDHEHDGQLQFQCLAQDEARLGQWALTGVDQQQDAVHHREGALDLATEVGVAGRVENVDLGLRAGVVGIPDGGVLGQDRDALLAFEIHGVHDPLGDVLI